MNIHHQGQSHNNLHSKYIGVKWKDTFLHIDFLHFQINVLESVVCEIDFILSWYPQHGIE